MVTIRKSNPDDTPQLEILFQLTRQYTFSCRSPNEFRIGDYAKSVEKDDVWIAEENGVIIGVVSIYPANNFIHNLFVHPHHQRKGIGTILLKQAEDNLEKPMTLKVSMDNSKACLFYQKHGWKEVSTHKDEAEPYWLYLKEK